jgi:hypothetical protein
MKCEMPLKQSPQTQAKRFLEDTGKERFTVVHLSAFEDSDE